MKIDFDEWLQLYRENPEEFERRRKEVIENAIASAPKEVQRNLRQFQWRIDAERLRHTSPMGSLIAIQKMMLDEVYREGGLLDALLVLLGKKGKECLFPSRKKTGSIIPFKQKE